MSATNETNNSSTPSQFLARCAQEHSILNRLYDDLVVAYNKKYRVKSVDKIIRILTLYVKFNFSNEEMYMAEIDYPDRVPHIEAHTTFFHELSMIKSLFQKGGDVYDRIRNLYTSIAHGHVPEDDEKLQQYVRGLSPDGG